MNAVSTYRDVPPQTTKEVQAFFGIINYLCRFSPSTADINELLRQLTSSKTEWTWNAIYQKLFDKVKSIITENFMMKPGQCTWRHMHLESDLELPYYKSEVGHAAQETKHQTTAYSDPSHLQARACQVQEEDIVTFKERY